MRCAHWRRVPLDLAREAREKWAATGIDRAVQCQLSAHDDGEHFGLLADVGEYGTALWLRWRGRSGAQPAALPDCPAVSPGPDGEGCCLFADHAKQHTWENALEEASCTSLIASPHNAQRPDLPRNEKCGDCGGSGANSSGKTCGTCNGLGEIHCRADRRPPACRPVP